MSLNLLNAKINCKIANILGIPLLSIKQRQLPVYFVRLCSKSSSFSNSKCMQKENLLSDSGEARANIKRSAFLRRVLYFSELNHSADQTRLFQV